MERPDTDESVTPASGEEELGAVADQVYDAVLAALSPRIPRATYRVQLHQDFGFGDARQIIDYLDALGVSDLYISPPFRARPGSRHGYDLVDPTHLSPELGDESAFERLTDRLKARGMGLLVDTVPNHMGIGSSGNAWWMDVLENGPCSLNAGFFDIDWHPLKVELANKVLLPILGDMYGRVLDRGELRLRYHRGAFFLDYFSWTLPINPRTYRVILDPVLPEIAGQLGDEHEAVLELQSILTGLRHLPARSETEPARIVERHREGAILKKRLYSLVRRWPSISEALARSLERLNGIPGAARSFDALDGLLEHQAYRLSYFRVAAEEINYRRFFDINDLAAVRMENPAVFEEAHRLIFYYLGEGRVTGLRIDHPDGLWDPGAYLYALQKRYFLEHCRRVFRGQEQPGTGQRAREAWAGLLSRLGERWDREQRESGGRRRPLYVVVEKILARGERLPDEFACAGTVGYEFGALLGALFVDHSNEKALTATYARETGLEPHFPSLVYQKKKLILQSSLASELNVLAHALNRLSETSRYSRDFTLGTLTHALVEVIAWFPVYRTYVNDREDSVSARDRQIIDKAIRLARRRSPMTEPSVYALLQSVLSLELSPEMADQRDRARELVMKFQQLTGPVMAKGLEDTAFYVYHRLTSLNEVGGEPERFGISPSTFHQANEERQRSSPHALVATSTHDSKRSEDVRARISVLSELPEAWDEALLRLRAATEGERGDVDGELAPDSNEQYLFYQTVIGTLPAGAMSDGALGEYTDRICTFMSKAMKEAKVNTSWINPNPDYDGVVERFVRAVLRRGSPFLDVLTEPEGLFRKVAYHGMWSSLSQLLIKLVVPGVPDFYQGSELWQLQLVDPDNRRPADFAQRRQLLDEIRARRGEGRGFLRELCGAAEDGRIKLFVTQAALAVRRERAALFADGAYVPLVAHGAHAEHLIAFARVLGDETLIAIAPRFSARLVDGRFVAPVADAWADTTIALPPGAYEDAFSGALHVTTASTGAGADDGLALLPLSTLLADFPLALLQSRSLQ